MDKTLQGLQDLFSQLEKTNDVAEQDRLIENEACKYKESIAELCEGNDNLKRLKADYWDGHLLAKLEIVDTGTLDTMVRDTDTGQTETYSHEFRAAFESEIDFKRAVASDFV